MSLPATDNFNRGDGALGANWTGSVGADLTIESQQIHGSASGENCMYWSADAPNAAQYAQIKITSWNWQYVACRMSATDFVCWGRDGTSVFRMFWYNGGSLTQIGTDYSYSPSANDVIKITANGSTFEGFINGTSRKSGSNASAPSTGYGGLRFWDGGGTADDFEVGNLGETTPTISKSEGVTLGESKTVTLSSSAISKSEGTTLGEALTVRLQALISKSEGVTLGESRTVTLSDLKINKSEGVTLGEVKAASLPNALAVSKSEGVTLGESKTVSLPNALSISKAEGVTLGESKAAATSDPAIVKSEGVTLGEALFRNLTIGVSKSEGVMLGEVAAQNLTIGISKTEGVTLGEAKAITLPDALVIGKSEGVTLGESSNVIEQVEGEYNLSVSDGVTIADGGAILMGDLGIAIDPAYLIYWSAGVEVV